MVTIIAVLFFTLKRLILEPKDGGFGFSSVDIGISQAINGIYIITCALFITPFVLRRLGLRVSYTLGVLLGAFAFFIMPNSAYFAPSNELLPTSIPFVLRNMVGWFALIVTTLTRMTAGQCCFTAVMLCINNSADSTMKGAANGIFAFHNINHIFSGLAQSLVAITRSFAPALSGSIIAATVTTKLPFPFDYRFVFNLMAFLSVIISIPVRLLPASIESPKPNPEELLQEMEEVNMPLDGVQEDVEPHKQQTEEQNKPEQESV